jgi:hypothetical protein
MAYNLPSELADAKLAENEAFRRLSETRDHPAWLKALATYVRAARRLQHAS